MIQVQFSQQELTALLQLMDIAVKAGGLQVAGPAAALQQKIISSYQDANTPDTDETVN